MEQSTDQKKQTGKARDSREDGSLWRHYRFHGGSAQECFRGWGATEVYLMPNQGDSLTRCMLRFPEGWRYGHDWDGAAYVSGEEPITARDGREAYLFRQYLIRRAETARTRKEVEKATEREEAAWLELDSYRGLQRISKKD